MGRRFAGDESSLFFFFVMAMSLAFFHFLGKYVLFSAWIVECLWRKPNWFSGIILFFEQKAARGLFMIISYTLLMLGRRLMGRRFAGDEPSLFFFVMAMSLAFFHFLGSNLRR